MIPKIQVPALLHTWFDRLPMAVLSRMARNPDVLAAVASLRKTLVRSVMIAAIALVGGLGAGCAGRAATQAPGAVDAYIAALDARDYGRAYELMSESYRKTHARADFVRAMKDSEREVKETVLRLRAGKRKTEISARLAFGELGDELLLVVEDGAWKIAQDPLAFYPQDTPGRALRSFLRAVELTRWDVVLRFVPKAYVEQMTPDQVRQAFEGPDREEVASRLRLLRAHLDVSIEEQGDSARMRFGDHKFEVVFLREDGLWKIEDPY